MKPKRITVVPLKQDRIRKEYYPCSGIMLTMFALAKRSCG